MSDSDELTAEIEKNFENFQNFVKRADDELTRHHYNLAAVYAQLAGRYAWLNHPGVYASPNLEHLLCEIGRTLPRPTNTVTEAAARQCILHVLTTAYKTGGHTRLVERWIRQDKKRLHRLAVTRQLGEPIPKALIDAVATNGGDISVLNVASGDLVRRAIGLRSLAAAAERVVVHAHPYDVVPVIALADRHQPVILVNHADHVFWLGTSLADLVVHIRPASIELSVERRGIPRARCLLLPLPLVTMNRQHSREVAKEKLGLPKDGVVLLSMGTAYKFHAPGKVPIIETVGPVLHSRPNAYLIIIGPEPNQEWNAATGNFGDRIRVCGRVENPALYFEAADIYLESFPTGSLTAVLEAGLYGLPVVTFYTYPAETMLFCGDDPALVGTRIVELNPDKFREVLLRLIDNSEWRVALGAQTREQIEQLHGEKNWRYELECLYDASRQVEPLTTVPRPASERATSPLDQALLRMHQLGRLTSTPEAVLRENARLLPFSERFALWRSRQTNFRQLFPESLGRRLDRVFGSLLAC